MAAEVVNNRVWHNKRLFNDSAPLSVPDAVPTSVRPLRSNKDRECLLRIYMGSFKDGCATVYRFSFLRRTAARMCVWYSSDRQKERRQKSNNGSSFINY